MASTGGRIMASYPEWIPELVYLEDFGGDFETYFEHVYELFKNDFINSKPEFRGRIIGLKRLPIEKGKVRAFWHVTHEGEVEADRIPDLRRFERIKWPRPIILNNRDPRIKCWRNKRNGEQRILLYLEEFRYLVVLADRGDYVLLWTTYVIEQSSRHEKLLKEYRRYMTDNPGNDCEKPGK